jgi:glycerol kinase
MEEYILGIDQGTTGTRVVVFDRAASIVGSAYSEFTQHKSSKKSPKPL